MDRYVLVLSFGQDRDDDGLEGDKCLAPVKQILDRLLEFSRPASSRRVAVLPACSLSGSPCVQRWFFALQACQGPAQFCSSDWEELGAGLQKADDEDQKLTALELCLGSLGDQEEFDQRAQSQVLTELFEEAAEGLHSLSDKLPPPGKALLDVLVLGSAQESPPLQDLLPLLGALKHMSCWHAANVTVITQHAAGWQKAALYLCAGLVEPTELDRCIDPRELWRGALLVREKKYVSELRFDGFSLRTPAESRLSEAPRTWTDLSLHSEVFHYYAPVLELVQLVSVSELPVLLLSAVHFELGLSGRSVKAKLLLDQLKSLRGKVGALFSLSCTVTSAIRPPAGQLSSRCWRESVARRPKSLPGPDVEVKGESAHYFLLVQGSDNTGHGACRVRMLHSDSQINGAAAMATVSGLLREKELSSSGAAGNILRSLPRLHGDHLLKRERESTRVQTLVLREYVPFQNISDQQSVWPERSVLHNLESLQKRRQKTRLRLLGPGCSDSLLGPRDGQRGSCAALDAKELLKHFTPDGRPTGDLQPLAVNRGDNMFQLSPDLSPGRLSRMPFSKASASHYHGIEFCLDERRSLDRDQAFARLQSRLIRFETHTTCSKEPGALAFALSPAPSPAVVSEPGSVPDGETLQNADVARLKRRRRDTDASGGFPQKRLAKSESSDSLCSQSSGSSGGTHPAVRSLRQQPARSRSSSSSVARTSSGSVSHSSADKTTSGEQTTDPTDPTDPTDRTPSEEKPLKESRSQKHNRMLQEVVAKTLRHHGIHAEHQRFEACSRRLFDISKFYLKDLKTSRGLQDEMKKAAGSNAKQVIDWVLEKASQT